jgi:hypothetical protein
MWALNGNKIHGERFAAICLHARLAVAHNENSPTRQQRDRASNNVPLVAAPARFKLACRRPNSLSANERNAITYW